MGFLDHSTNNIIVDAVLTDIGRQSLARNDGSFSIYQFALSDDEVDSPHVYKDWILNLVRLSKSWTLARRRADDKIEVFYFAAVPVKKHSRISAISSGII